MKLDCINVVLVVIMLVVFVVCGDFLIILYVFLVCEEMLKDI